MCSPGGLRGTLISHLPDSTTRRPRTGEKVEFGGKSFPVERVGCTPSGLPSRPATTGGRRFETGTCNNDEVE